MLGHVFRSRALSITDSIQEVLFSVVSFSGMWHVM